MFVIIPKILQSDSFKTFAKFVDCVAMKVSKRFWLKPR